MKKLLFVFMLIWIILVSCEKIRYKLDGDYTSDLFELPTLDSVKLYVHADNEIIIGASISNEIYQLEVDSISSIMYYYNYYLPVVYFNFKKEGTRQYFASLEIEETDSKNYELVGYLHIKDPDTDYDRWRYILYFK